MSEAAEARKLCAKIAARIRAGETLLIPLREAVEPLIYSRESEKSTRIVCACLGNDAGIYGAARLIL